jgi:hypothetical protein
MRSRSCRRDAVGVEEMHELLKAMTRDAGVLDINDEEL